MQASYGAPSSIVRCVVLLVALLDLSPGFNVIFLLAVIG
jgi:hypothetical protein